MPTIEKHNPGAFSWIELSTSDQNAAKVFYTSLFGWTINDFPMGPNDVYTMFQLNGRDAAAAASQQKGETAAGVPPHWNLYVAVDNADDTAKRASASGGKVLAGPFDVFDSGRMAVIQDPTGAVILIWQAKQHIGLGVSGENNTLCWADLNTPDPQTASAFYSGLFGWTIEPGKDGSYLHIKNGKDYIGGIPAAGQTDPNAPPHWLIYMQVADCDAATNKAKELGARVYFGPMSMENVGRMSMVADPQGAVFSLFEPGRGVE